MIQLSNDDYHIDYHIEISDQQSRTFDSEKLVHVVRLILQNYGVASAEISIALVDDPTMRELNRQYLDHDYATDVLSFLLNETEDAITGQLIVSTDTAARVAEELGIQLEHELLLYVIHGTLHLVGLDDTQPDLADEMRAAECEFLGRLGIGYHWLETDK
jgi:probable rRNA maturation factor